MQLVKARVQGYRSIIDTGYFEVERGKTILVGPNEAGKTAILQALQKLNPPEGTELFTPLRDYPRAKYDEDIEKGNIDPSEFTVVEGHFALNEHDKEGLPETYKDIIYTFGRKLDNSAWHHLENAPPRLCLSDIEKDLQKMLSHFQETAEKLGATEASITSMKR